MTKSEINLMLHNFEATVTWRNVYKHPFYKDYKLIEAITNEIASGNNTICNIRKIINLSIKVQQTMIRDILDTYIGVLWYMVPGKKTIRYYYLIESDNV